MQSSHSLDRLHTTFDEPALIAHAGLLLPATTAYGVYYGVLGVATLPASLDVSL